MTLSKYLYEHGKIPLLIGLSGAIVWYIGSRGVFTRPKLPTEWEEVGTVSQLLIYPLKSAKPISVTSAEATTEGLRRDLLGDRTFIVITDKGEMVTGRQIGTLVTIETAFRDETILDLKALDGQTVSVDINDVNAQKKLVKFKIRGDLVQGYDCGDEASQFLSRHLFPDGSKKGRLIFVGDRKWRRQARKYEFKFPLYENSDTTVYNDSTSYNIATEASLAELNSRIDAPVAMLRFRPPIVIKGSKPFDEDNWKYIKIGNSAILHTAKPCERCVLTTVNPDNGTRTTEHFDELKRYRIVDSPESLSKFFAQKPVFGLGCGIDVTGKVNVGDKVFVYRERPYWNIKAPSG